MAEIGTFEVKVSTEALVRQAEEVRRLGTEMRQYFSDMAETMERTRYYWIGDAGEAHRRLYDEQKDDIELMLRRLMEHPDDLTKISQNYVAVENTNTATANSLDVDVIM